MIRSANNVPYKKLGPLVSYIPCACHHDSSKAGSYYVEATFSSSYLLPNDIATNENKLNFTTPYLERIYVRCNYCSAECIEYLRTKRINEKDLSFLK